MSTAQPDLLAFSPVTETVHPKDEVVFENDSAAPPDGDLPRHRGPAPTGPDERHRNHRSPAGFVLGHS